MREELLEILIGRYLDGEITSSEQQILEAVLEKDFQARELFEQLQELHQCSRELVAAEIVGRGHTTEEIFERAWPRTKISLNRFCWARENNRAISKSRFWCGVAGLAAGLAIGLALHFVLSVCSEPKGNEVLPNPIVRDIERQYLQLLVPDSTEDVIRNVDWYSFTDEDGDQWLIEGYRENIVRPAVYHEGL